MRKGKKIMSIFTGPMKLHLNGHKDWTLHKEVLKSIDPDVVWIPLVNGAAPCQPLVQVGDEVKIGQNRHIKRDKK